MPTWFQAIVVLVIVWVLARMIKRNWEILQRYFIPSSIVGGVVLLLIGPQIVGVIPKDISGFLATLPALLINIVFAGMFIGRKTPGPKQIWRQAGPMIAFGSGIAWGMYVIGILLTIFILGPLFGTPPIFGALLEISFSGGHGTAAGLAPMFAELGWPEATDLALGLATFSIIMAVITGIAMINIYNRRIGRVIDRGAMALQQRRMIRNGYDLTNVSSHFERNPKQLIMIITLLAIAIAFGWVMLQGLVWLENTLLGDAIETRFFVHLPLFPLAMFGGLIVQLILRATGNGDVIHVKMVRTVGAMALDLLIITAIGTMSLNAIGDNFFAFALLAFAGVAWIWASFYFFARRFFRKHWFVYGMTDVGQAMGMTATGLLLNRLVDPINRTGAREAFAYKQLAFEPFMGGGIVTAMSAVILVELGHWTMLIVSTIGVLFWLVVGLEMGRKHSKRSRWQTVIAKFAIRK